MERCRIVTIKTALAKPEKIPACKYHITASRLRGVRGMAWRTIARTVISLGILCASVDSTRAQPSTIEPGAVRIGTAPVVSPEQTLAYFAPFGTVSTSDTLALPDIDFQGVVTAFGQDPIKLSDFVRDHVDMAWANGLGRGARGVLIEQNEGAKFWLRVLNELKNRGVADICWPWSMG